MAHYQDLRAWRIAHELAEAVHKAVDSFPLSERFELSSQLRRAALSVPTNLAEGQGRFGPREALRFARIAAGSLAEVDYLLLFAFERGYLDTSTYESLMQRRKHASRIVDKLIRSLRSAARTTPVQDRPGPS
ncbi:MAG: four helix bundle protein [Gemmatimonadota bacterium]|nr:MAG: four helix bundle protein [Gemmatimonadota bacterium]